MEVPAQSTPDAAVPAALFGIAAGTWKSLFATAFIALALLLGAGVSFASLERQQVMICGILVLGTIVGTLMVRPDYWAALLGCLTIWLRAASAGLGPRGHSQSTASR